MKLSAGAFSDAGRVRDNNEDAHVVDDRLALFAIADGMGGHVAGEVASWTAIEALRAAVANGRPINDAITLANAAVLERATGDPKLTGMGTTMNDVAWRRRRRSSAVGTHAASCTTARCVSSRRPQPRRREAVREGRLTAEQGSAIVTRVWTPTSMSTCTLGVVAATHHPLLGRLTDMVRERDIERIARSESDPQRTAELLVDAANAAGGVDNITVVVLDVEEVDADAPLDPEALVVDADPPLTPVPQVAPEVPAPTPPEPRTPLGRRVRGALLLLIPLLSSSGSRWAPWVGMPAVRSMWEPTTTKSWCSVAFRAASSVGTRPWSNAAPSP
jgi:protein phosphatase